MLSTKTECVAQRLKRIGCARINDLGTYNPTNVGNEEGRVPSSKNVPRHWRGRWGTHMDITSICMLNGDLYMFYGEPNSDLRSLLENEELFPGGGNLRVPYFNGESLSPLELLGRFRDSNLEF